jgi:predicted MPP superfamily phosphohydrolase
MSWIPTHSDDVVILHFSDLHFGAHNQEHVFQEITPFIRDQVRPDLVLVTGDVVDSPARKSFEEAKQALSAATRSVPIFVCPGNHDRFRKGNRWWLWSPRPSPLFRDQFSQHLLSPNRVHYEAIRGWRIGLIEIDSATEADYFARGYVARKEIDTVVHAARSAECDICIALTHHHPLPVRALEAARKGKLAALANVTALVNAGTLLEAVANANIDVILHGHDHCANWARYGSLEHGRGEVCILGAGSGTGNHSIGGCKLEDVSFNVIVLGVDRSVRTRVVKYDGQFSMRELGLFDAATIRRRRLLRSLARHNEVLQDDLGTEVTKSVRFTPERDIAIDIEFTSWKVDRECKYPVNNTTGIPVDAVVTLTGPKGTITPNTTIAPTHEKSDWVIRWDVPPSHARPVVCAQKLSYVWRGGALLESGDLVAQQAQGLGFLRGEGYEYASIRAFHSTVTRATLVVRLPPWAAPSDVEVRAYDDHYVRHGEEEAELSQRVRSLGAGHYVLAVPFPRTGWLYALAWRPPTLPLSQEQRDFITRAQEEGVAMLNAFRRGAVLGSEYDLALYLVDQGVLSLSAHESPSGTAPRAQIPMLGDRLLLAQAAWGVLGEVRAPHTAAYEAGLAPGETVVWAIPVRSLLNTNSNRVLGVLRVATRASTPAGTLAMFTKGLANLLTVAA